MPAKEEREVGIQLSLSLVEYQLRGGSISHGPDGQTFACTFGPISDETMMALDRAAQNHGTIRLLFPEPLLLDLISIERKEPQRVRIVGRVFDAAVASE
jgi:hypothetical protein